jgi:hypothetical protein
MERRKIKVSMDIWRQKNGYPLPQKRNCWEEVPVPKTRPKLEHGCDKAKETYPKWEWISPS